MIQDAQGHHLSGATEAGVTAYDRAVRAFNLVHGDVDRPVRGGLSGRARFRHGISGKSLGVRGGQ